MKILVCGSRNWEDENRLISVLWRLSQKHTLEIIEGGAPGADRIAQRWAITNDVDLITVDAEWEKYGRSAGPKRNLKMLDMNPDLVLAFQRNGSRGTQHTINSARERGIKVRVYNG